jgi:hypothetical protein
VYPLKAATTKACLNKILNDYVVNVTQPKCLSCYSGTQLASQIWKNNLAEMNTEVMFSPLIIPVQPKPNM